MAVGMIEIIGKIFKRSVNTNKYKVLYNKEILYIW